MLSIYAIDSMCKVNRTSFTVTSVWNTGETGAKNWFCFLLQATNKGLSMSYKNLTLYGLGEMKVCGKIRKSLGMGSETWTTDVCLPRLTTTIDTVTGPGKLIGEFFLKNICYPFHQY